MQLKSRETYEIMRAEDVGWAENRMVLGKHSGRRAIRERLLALGIDLQTEEELNDVFKKFKELADKKHEIFDEDLRDWIKPSLHPSSLRHHPCRNFKTWAETTTGPSLSNLGDSHISS